MCPSTRCSYFNKKSTWRVVADLKFNRPGERFVVRTHGALVIVDLCTIAILWKVGAPLDCLGSVVFCGHDDDFVLTNNSDSGYLELYSAETGVKTRTCEDADVVLIERSLQGEYVVTTSIFNEIFLYAADPLSFITFTECGNQLQHIVFTQPEGVLQLYSAFSDFSVTVWNIPSLEAVHRFQVVNRLDVSSDGSKMLVGIRHIDEWVNKNSEHSEHSAALCDPKSGNVFNFLNCNLQYVTDVCFSPCGVILM